ncbi:MAG: hypothetical protein ACFFED_10520 [Candidatus Thorarchaeota archaeon]
MERRYSIVIVVAAVSIIIIGAMVPISLFPPPLTPMTGLEWGVDVGDIFQYHIRTIGNTYGGLYASSEIHRLNGTIINATITALPPLDHMVEQYFAERVIRFSKVNCTFANGTSLSLIMELIVCEGLSGCVLPIGNWSSIAGLYPNTELGGGSGTEEYVTVLEDEYLTMHYFWYGTYDDNGGWWGDSSLPTGMPLNTLWFYEHQGQTIYIELTLVE